MFVHGLTNQVMLVSIARACTSETTLRCSTLW